MLKKLRVEGMTCAVCAQGIERNVNAIEGVNSVAVSLMTKEVLIDINEKIVSIEKIIAVIEKLGYAVPSNNAIDEYREAKTLKTRFIISLLLLLPLMYFSMGKMFGAPVFINKINFVIEWIFATIIILINFKFYSRGIRAVVNKSPNMDTLVSLGSFSAYIYGVIVTIGLLVDILNPSHTFFESSAMVLALVTLGKYFEELSKVKTGNEIEKLNKLIPKTATIIKDGKQVVVLTAEINVGDIVVFKAGEYIAIDGVVTSGQASIDKSAITGESIPEEVTIGGKVYSGSILTNGFLLVEAQKVGSQTLFSKIVEAVKIAGASKAPVQRIADKVSSVFVPIVTLLAIITFSLWLIFSGNIYTAVNFGISVLVISCPCALGLATPVAIMASTGAAAREGILFKNAEAIQKASEINCILLDKTATITVGKPKVTDFENLSLFDDLVVKKIAGSLEKKSSHPLAQSVIDFCGENECEVQSYQYILGKGIIGEINQKNYYLGNFELIPSDIRFLVEDRAASERYFGKTLVFLATDEEVLAVFAVSDYVKEDSKEAIQSLQNQGIKTVMITGDNKTAATKIANEVGITDFAYEVLPQTKFEIVNEYKNKGFVVAMVGDGINDSPALKSADVGIAVGTGTDIAIDSADVVLVGGKLTSLTKTISISRKSIRIIKQNLFWAFLYNIIAIPIAGGALNILGVVLTPAIASGCMCLSSLFVVSNALRISRRKRIKRKKRDIKTVVLSVEGMMCGHCQSKVKEALSAIVGVSDVKVDLENKKATLTYYGSVADKTFIDVVENAGFSAKIEK